jgi:long-chain acyl-CoA synthetase
MIMGRVLLERIALFAAEQPQHLALADNDSIFSYLELQQEIERVAPTIRGRRVGLLMDNGCCWAIIDLCLQKNGAVCVPMPAFFSDRQLQHLISNAGLDTIITDQPLRIITLLQTALPTQLAIAEQRFDCFLLTPPETLPLPAHTAKITYTSGTTAQPKGVCLAGGSIERVTESMCDVVAANDHDRSLTLLPLSTLLANIGGIYAPLYRGSSAFLPDLAECGMTGSTDVNPDLLIATLNHAQPTVTIVVPFMLKILVEAATKGTPLPGSLRYIAVGGAPISPLLLDQARDLGLPVYQGYGLSEAASVVSMEAPGREHNYSAGRPLRHVNVRIADDGEIMVSGNVFAAYLGQAPHGEQEWPTGDIGFLDASGELHITGRKKTAFATAHGRKLAPEWIESELTSHPIIAQAVLFGEGRHFNTAVVVPNGASAVSQIGDVITVLNHTLPDYARISRWIIAEEPFSIRNGLANGAGTLNRDAIEARYALQLEEMYQGNDSNVFL